MNKTANPQIATTRQQINNWIHSILNDIPLTFKIEQLGKGVIYCRILNHYFPGIMLINRIIWTPKSEYQNILNLKTAQSAMAQLKINIQIEPIRLSKQKLNDNWNFITALHKYLNQNHEDSYNMAPPAQQKIQFSFYPQMMAQPIPTIFTPKRTIEHLYPQNFYQGIVRPQLFPIDQNIQVHNSYYNASKYSVGKLQGISMQMASSSPSKGKWSVNSHMFQNNLAPIIDRIKQILLKPFNNTQKIRQIKILLNIPLNEEVIVKVEQDQNVQIIVTNPQKNTSQTIIQEKEDIKQIRELWRETIPQNHQQVKLTQ